MESLECVLLLIATFSPGVNFLSLVFAYRYLYIPIGVRPDKPSRQTVPTNQNLIERGNVTFKRDTRHSLFKFSFSFSFTRNVGRNPFFRFGLAFPLDSLKDQILFFNPFICSWHTDSRKHTLYEIGFFSVQRNFHFSSKFSCKCVFSFFAL